MPTYYIDPVNGNDANNGSTWALAFKTLKKTFAAGDIILVAKNVETAVAGTITAAHHSFTLNTTDDLTGTLAQYSIVRINGENRLYMIRSISSSAITLYTPYKGEGASGLSMTYLTLPTAATADWQPTSGSGAVGNLITLRGGINPTDDSQDGFTIINGATANYGITGTFTRWEVQRFGTYYFYYLWQGQFTDSIITDCYALRTYGTFTYNAIWTRTVVNGFVAEQAIFKIGMIDCILNDLETSDYTHNGWDVTQGYRFCNNVINRWRNTGRSGYVSLNVNNSPTFNNRFYDAMFDISGSGGTNINLGGSADGWLDFTFVNPVFGAGTVLYVGNYGLSGEIKMVNVNGDPTDNRKYVGRYYEGWVPPPTCITGDYSVYNTEAPSSKVALNVSVYSTSIRYYIPCEAGVQKTISVYVRKNSSYGSAGAGTDLPKMSLQWLTGTSGNLVSNSHDVVMSNTADTFEKLEYAVTPGVQGVIVMELTFRSANAGAIAWYDDIGVA